MILVVFLIILQPVDHGESNPVDPIDEAVILKHLDALAGPDEKTFEALKKAGAFRQEALPFYLKLLNQDPPLDWSHQHAVMLRVRGINADRTVFRPLALKSLSNAKKAVAHEAVRLLEAIGTEDEAPAVASMLRQKGKDNDYYTSVVKTLAAIGTEKEIDALDEAREAGLLKEDGRF